MGHTDCFPVMHPTPLRLVSIIAALLLGACQKKRGGSSRCRASTPPKSDVETARRRLGEGERAQPNFAAVNKHLELGGTLYGYVDVDGDVLKLTGQLQRLLAEIGEVATRRRHGRAAGSCGRSSTMLGLTDVKAIGVSSVPDGSGFFRNRLFIYTGGERHGLMAALGGKPAPFKHLGPRARGHGVLRRVGDGSRGGVSDA